MKIKSLITFIVGIIVVIIGVVFFIKLNMVTGSIPALIGCSLIYLGWRGGRAAAMIFGVIA